jgi:hypothetical protein
MTAVHPPSPGRWILQGILTFPSGMLSQMASLSLFFKKLDTD